MTVRIVVDDLGLYQMTDAEDVLTPEVNELYSVRERIRYHLASGVGGTLVLRMPSDIFQRFSDMEGQPGLVVEHVSPRRTLRDRLGCPPPAWLGQDLARALGLFADDLPQPVTAGGTTSRVLSLIDPDLLVVDDLNGFVQILSRQRSEFKQLLVVPEVSRWLISRLEHLGLSEAVNELVRLLTNGLKEGYRELARSIVRERLDGFMARHGLIPDFALPPRVCLPVLVRQFEPLPIDEQDAGPYPDYLQQLLSLAERRTHGGEMPVEALADFVMQDWPVFFDQFQTLFEQNPKIANEPLVEALNNLESIPAGELAKRMREYLDNAQCAPLTSEASVKEVLLWSERYFRYAIGAFERGEEPDEQVSVSFAQWVTAEHNRIIQSEYDWRVVARTVDQELEAGKVVILCVVDALGAIHNDLIEIALHEKLDQMVLSPIKSLFAPLPTITEVGKIAVLTGQDARNQAADYERVLRDRYSAYLTEPAAFQFVRNWKDFRQALHRETRLLVCLDNRVDDDLHQCTDFRHHRERVRSVAEQLVQLISQWLMDAARFGHQATILITADHGATKVSRQVPAVADTTPMERRILFTPREPTAYPDGFYFEQTERTGGGYLIPHARVAYGATENMLHGGLTPEEVLIPFVRITRERGQVTTALRLQAREDRCHPVTNGWHVTLCIENAVNEAFFNLRILVMSPFSGEHPVIDRLGPYEDRNEIIFRITAEFEQTGKTTVPFELRYQPIIDAPFERLIFNLDLDFGTHLIERNQATREFDDFFD